MYGSIESFRLEKTTEITQYNQPCMRDLDQTRCPCSTAQTLYGCIRYLSS